MKFSSTDKEPAHLSQRWGASVGNVTGYTGNIFPTRCGPLIKWRTPTSPLLAGSARSEALLPTRSTTDPNPFDSDLNTRWFGLDCFGVAKLLICAAVPKACGDRDSFLLRSRLL